MTWHGSHKSLPELAGLPDDEKRRGWERFQRRTAFRMEDWRWWAFGLLSCAVLSLVLALVLQSDLWAGPRPRPAPGDGPALRRRAVRLWWRVSGRVDVWLYRDLLLSELPGRCRGCGYDLTGNASGACPECGRAAAV